MGLINIAKIAKAAHWQCPVSLYACLATIADKAIKTAHERGITPIPNFGRVEFCQKKSVFVFVFFVKRKGCWDQSTFWLGTQLFEKIRTERI